MMVDTKVSIRFFFLFLCSIPLGLGVMSANLDIATLNQTYVPYNGSIDNLNMSVFSIYANSFFGGNGYFDNIFNKTTTNSTGLIGLTCANGKIAEMQSGKWTCGTDSSGASESWVDANYLAIDGSNANTNIDIGSYNITADNIVAEGGFGAGIGVEDYITDTAKVVAMGDSADFHIRQANGDLSAIFGSDNDGNGYFFVGEPGLTSTNAKIRFWSSPTQNNWVNNGKNFGIGTDTPSEKLDVNGSIISDKLYTNNVNATSLGTIGGITNPDWTQSAFYLEDSFANKLGFDGNQMITEVPNDFFFQNTQSGFVWETNGDATDRMSLDNTGLTLEGDLDINSGTIQMDSDEVLKIGTLDSLTGNGGRIQIQVDESGIDGLQFKNSNVNGQVRFLVKDDLNNYMVMNSVNSVGPGGNWLDSPRNDFFWLWAYSPFDTTKGLGIGTINAGDVILGANDDEYIRLDASEGNIDLNKPIDFKLKRNTNFNVQDPLRIYQSSTTDGGNLEFWNEATPTDGQQLGEMFGMTGVNGAGNKNYAQFGFAVNSVSDATGKMFFSTANGVVGGDLESSKSLELIGNTDGTANIYLGNGGDNYINGNTYINTTDGTLKIYNNSGWGTIEYGTAIEHTYLTNTTDKEAYELVQFAQDNFYKNGITDYTAWGECYYVDENAIDYSKPIITEYCSEEINEYYEQDCNIETVCKYTETPICEMVEQEPIKSCTGEGEQEICENIYQEPVEVCTTQEDCDYVEEEVCISIPVNKTENNCRESIKYPFTKVEEGINVGCKQTMIAKADAYERQTIKVYDDTVDIDSNIMANNIFFKSKAVSPDTDYTSIFSDATPFLTKHASKYTENIELDTDNIVQGDNVEDQIKDMQGYILQNEFCRRNNKKFDDYNTCMDNGDTLGNKIK